MKWLRLDYIKAHSRIDFDCEDAELELLACSAEDAILNLCGRSAQDFIAEYNEIPNALYLAALQLTEHFYTNRGIVQPGNLSVIPYSFDILLKPYIKL